MTINRMHTSILLTSILLTLSTIAQSNSLDVSLNQDTAQFKFHYGTDAMESEQGGPKLGLLYNENSDYMVFGTFLVPNEGSNGFQLSPGVKLNYISLEEASNDFNTTLAVGLKLGGVIPIGLPLLAYGSAYYAPPVTAFGDVESSIDTELGIKVNLSQNALIYTGYRRVLIELEDVSKDFKLDDSFHLGFIFSL